MSEALNTLIEPPIKYAFAQGPKRIHTLNQARRLGANCETITHLAIAGLFRFRLPSRLLSYELLCDRTLITSVSSLRAMRLGDIIILGAINSKATNFKPDYDMSGDLRNWAEGCPAQHVGVYAGDSRDGDPLVLDTSHLTGQASVRPLKEIMAYSQHAVIQRIGRLTTVG